EAAISSFVVVLPVLPVSPTTLAGTFFRASCPQRHSACTGSSTCTRAAGASISAWGGRVITAAAAPARAASWRKAWPSVRVPGSAKKSPFSARVRVSMENEVRSVRGEPRSRLPPVASTTSPTLSGGIASPSHLGQGPPHQGTVVAHLHAVGEGLGGLVS